MRHSEGSVHYFQKSVTVHRENQGAIALTHSTQMRPCNNHTVLKYHHLWSLFEKCDTGIKHVETK